MSWRLDDDAMLRALGAGQDARCRYAIDKICEHGELWTLAIEGEWVVSEDRRGRRSIVIWPHERLAAWEPGDAIPERIAIDDWLSDERARWFDDLDLFVTVFGVEPSSVVIAYPVFAELLRQEQRRRRRAGHRSAGTARRHKRATRTSDDLIVYVNDREIELVLGRVPAELRTRVGDVVRRQRSDAKVLGSVTTRGRRDINLSAMLPIRVSLGRYLHGRQSPEEFGAPKHGQWPPWAVRRFLLYDVLLHELGHLQVIDPKAARVERKFASETRAQEFADELRRTLHSKPFGHADPIHDAPTPGELATLEVWHRLDKVMRARLTEWVLYPDEDHAALLAELEPRTDEQRAFLASVLTARRT